MNNLEKKIEELLTRSIAQILPSKEAFKEVLLRGEKLKIYVGADATGPQLHLGHATNFMLLEQLRQLGHEVIVLFGDFTAMLGDPSDKNAARVQLTREQVEENIATWEEQVEKILDFDDPKNPAKIARNGEWLSPLTLTDVIRLASSFTVQQMLERDMFEKRMQTKKPVHLHEFLYPLLQGYDSVAMDVDVEIGGTDQTFNMLAGRTLQKQYHQKEKFIIATTLLENPKTGKKLMSKSEGGYIALNDSANEMFGKVMALPDEVIVQIFIDCTYVSLEEIEKVKESLEHNSLNPRDAKLRLAKGIVKIYHDEEAAEAAEDYFVSTFSKRQAPEELEKIKTVAGASLADVIVEANLAESKADARRKIEQGGVELEGEKITDREYRLAPEDDKKVLKVGKKDFRKILLSGIVE